MDDTLPLFVELLFSKLEQLAKEGYFDRRGIRFMLDGEICCRTSYELWIGGLHGLLLFSWNSGYRFTLLNMTYQPECGFPAATSDADHSYDLSLDRGMQVSKHSEFGAESLLKSNAA